MEKVTRLIQELDSRIAENGLLAPAEARQFQEQFEMLIQTQATRITERDARTGDDWFRPAELELFQSYLRRGISSRVRSTRPVYQHLLISAEADDLADALHFSRRFADVAADFFEEARAVSVTEEEIAACAEKDCTFGDDNCRILLIEDFHAEAPERFEAGVEALGIGRYALILCCTEEAAKRVREYAGNDYRLSRYLLRQQYRFSRKSVADILDRCFHILQSDGRELTDDFRKKLGLYVEAVYPEAVRKDQAFVQDLLIRIEDTRAERLCFDNMLTALDVPFSVKAARLAETRRTESAERSAAEAKQQAEPNAPEKAAEAEMKAPEIAAEAEPTAPEVLTLDEFSAEVFAFDNVGLTSVGDEQKRTNILLLSLSTFPQKCELPLSRFLDEDNPEKVYNGRYQLDPVPKKIAFDLQQSRGGKLDYVIMLCSRQTRETRPKEVKAAVSETKQVILRNISAEEYFTAQIKPYLRQGIPAEKQFTSIDVEPNDPAAAIRKAIRTIRNLAEASNPEKRAHLYIDIHGGLRDTQMLTQSIISLLQTDENSIPIDVYSVKYDGNANKNSITRTDETLRIINFVSGIREVINYGRTASLRSYFPEPPKKNKSKNQPVVVVSPAQKLVQKLMLALDNTVEGISWCNTERFKKGLDDLQAFFSEQPEIEDVKGNEYLDLFYENIKRGYGRLLTSERTVVDEIRWCADHSFFQQALTLIESRMPFFLGQAGIIRFDADALSGKAALIDGAVQDAPPLSETDQFNDLIREVGRKGSKSRNKDNKYATYRDQIQSCFKQNPDCHFKTYLNELKEADVNAMLTSAQAAKHRFNADSYGNTSKTAFFLELNLAFCDTIDRRKLAQLLLLHVVLKNARNMSNHALDEENEYGSGLISKGISCYLSLAEELAGEARACSEENAKDLTKTERERMNQI